MTGNWEDHRFTDRRWESPRRKSQRDLFGRVVKAAEAALADHSYVSCIDVLCGMGLLPPGTSIRGAKDKSIFSSDQFKGIPTRSVLLWRCSGGGASRRGSLQRNPLRSTHTERDDRLAVQQEWKSSNREELPHALRFAGALRAQAGAASSQARPSSADGRIPDSAQLPMLRMRRGNRNGLLTIYGSGQPLCLPCGRLDDLELLPSGDTALTRRATKYSGRVAVVVRFSRSRRRYERQGILVEAAALEKAEQECTEDADERAAARVRAAERRHGEDRALAARMAQQIGALFPGCPSRSRGHRGHTRRGAEAGAWAGLNRAESWTSKH